MAKGRAQLNSGSKQETDLPKAKINKQSLKKVITLVKYLKPYRVKFFLGIFFLILTALTSLAFPRAMGNLIDAANLSKGLSNINTIAIVLLGILFFQAITTFLKVIWFVEVAERSLADLRKDTYFKLVTLPMTFFAQRRVGELNSRISADLSQIQDSITITIAELLRQIITLIGGIIALSLVSVKLTLMMLAIFPVLIGVAVVFGKYIRGIARKSQDQLAESNVIVEETLQGISNVKAFVNEAYETLRYKKSMNEVIKYALKGAKFRGAFSAFIIFCLFGSIVIVVWYGSTLVQKGDITVGELTTFILYATYVGAAMGSFADLYSQLQKTVGATERVIELLDEKNEDISLDVRQGIIDKKINGKIEFNNIQFAYPTRIEIEVLKGLSFTANIGEKVAIVGQSGAGKSTIASLLLRFYTPDSGSITFDDVNAAEYSLSDIRNQIAIVPQDVLLFGGSIRENICYGKIDASNDELITAARQANAHDFIMSFPEGYETVVGERGIKLSGGQRQRIAIARALLKNPAILILDEATSSLDSESERLVQEALQILMSGRTSIIIAHRLSTIREADQIIVIDEGIVKETGTHQELMNNESGLYRYLSQLQLQETIAE
ncbi:MAG: ATP-binding cassette domain-containing protein [Sphingobacteriales bacterium]|jgi:ABC transporter fused permease/ATP-binding protein|nr:ATP-binding cassette domain-containing protein [Sphingobacteriales bacterium]